MLYALRYEDTGNLRAVKSRLLDSGLAQEKVDLLDALLQYSGESLRFTSPLFPASSPRYVHYCGSNVCVHNMRASHADEAPDGVGIACFSGSGNASRGAGLFGQDNLMSKLGKQITTTLQASWT